MRKLYTLIFIISFSMTFAQVSGTWQVANQAGAIGVGPDLGNISWWSNNEGDLTLRACYFDDRYVFDEDGTFINGQDGESWIEEWQGSNPPSCGVPVAPHDGSNAATWTYDDVAGTITLDGVGAYLGLAKVYNEGELTNPADAPESITYMVTFTAEDTMTIDISIGTGYWRYILAKVDASAIDEDIIRQVNVYPNPVSNVLYLDHEKAFENIAIYSVTGQLMYQSDQHSNKIMVGDFPTGIYSLRAMDAEGIQYIAKFMVQ